MIHKINNSEFVISSYGVWRPGVYDSKKTANYAFRFTDDELFILNGEVNSLGNVIRYKDLQNLRKNRL